MATYNLLFTTRTQLGYHPVGTKPRDWLLPGKNWQLVINTGTTIITFLMVFLIQKSQNKEAMAVQLKLNELVAAHEFASNRLVDVEDMTEDELKVIQKYYAKLKSQTEKEESLRQSHSIDEAQEMFELKKGIEKGLKKEVKEAKEAKEV